MSAATKASAPSSQPSKEVADVLGYLQHRMPAYPYHPKIDRDFVEELVEDFGTGRVLDEIKNFRWFKNSEPVSNLRSVRLTLRRWIANSKKNGPS